MLEEDVSFVTGTVFVGGGEFFRVRNTSSVVVRSLFYGFVGVLLWVWLLVSFEFRWSSF